MCHADHSNRTDGIGGKRPPIRRRRQHQFGNQRVEHRTVAVLRVLRRLNVLPSLEQHLPSLLLPFSPSKSPLTQNRLHRNRRHDHHLLFPPNLLHLSMRSPLAIRLSRRNHHHGHLHHPYSALPGAFRQQIPVL